MRLGIFGGSFNPPHRGHRVAAEAFCREIQADHLLVVPAGIPPHKELVRACTDAQRLAMTRLNFDSLPTPCTVTDLEMKRAGKSYTLDTLLEIQRACPEAQLFLYCGSDMLADFHTWYEYRRILSLCTLCVMKRREDPEGWEEALSRLNREARNPLRVLTAPHWEESSSHLRACLAARRDTPGLMPAVADYIRKEGLYL